MADKERGWTPATTAQYDQLLAAAEAELGRVADVFKAQTAQLGERQAMVNFVSVFSERDGIELAAFLAVAIRRMTGESSQDD